MRVDLKKIVDDFRKKGASITDEEADEVERICIRKMEVSRIKDPDMYLPLLFEDELNDYLFRIAINAASLLLMFGKENTDV